MDPDPSEISLIQTRSRPDSEKPESDNSTLLPEMRPGIASSTAAPRSSACKKCQIWVQRQRWLPEQLSVIFSVASVSGLAVLLHAFDGRALTDWTLPITLNAFVSVLVTILYTLLLVPVSSCLAQLQWTEFESASSFPHFELYGQASCGVFGSIHLLCCLPKCNLGIFGSILVLLIATIGPSTQQVLSVAIASHPSLESRGYPVLSSIPIVVTEAVSEFSKYAVYRGLLAQGDTGFDLKVNCSNTNCTWDSYTTLAIRHQCNDVSDYLKLESQTILVNDSQLNRNWTSSKSTATLPNGDYLEFFAADPESDWQGATNITSILQPVSLTGLGNTLSHSFIIHAPKASSDLSNNTSAAAVSFENTTATECVLQIVARSLTANVTNADFFETSVGPDVTNNNDTAQWGSPWQLFLNNSENVQTVQRQGPQKRQKLGFITYDVPRKYLQAYDLQSSCARNDCENALTKPPAFESNPATTVGMTAVLVTTFSGGTTPNVCGNTTNEAFQDGVNAFCIPGAPIYCVPEATGYNVLALALKSNSNFSDHSHEGRASSVVDTIFKRVADSLTYSMRTQAHVGGGITNGVFGSSTKAVITYSIDWPWITVPAALCLAVAILLLSVMRDNKRKKMPVWKGSSLAVTVHALDAAAKLELLDLVDVLELERAAKKTRVRREKGDMSLVIVKSLRQQEDQDNGNLQS